MNLETTYPKLFAKLEEKDLELRHLLNVDENYEDFDSEEYEFDHEDYNYVIYIAEPVQNALGADKMEEFMVKLHDNDAFETFFASEQDLYGVKTARSEEEIVAIILELAEDIV
jgi:hypothetical protein